jgi:hypothetical protein
MFHVDIVQKAVRDSRGRFTGEYDIHVRRFLLTRMGDTAGLWQAQLIFCPIILWVTFYLTGG